VGVVLLLGRTSRQIKISPEKAIDEVLKDVAASNGRIANMESSTEVSNRYSEKRRNEAIKAEAAPRVGFVTPSTGGR
jgi:hypothetical protein